nr:copia-type polyprotein [Tanacetum cinerariifolium]
MFVKEFRQQHPTRTWNGLKPTVAHLRVFGSIAYVHVPSQRRLKLADRSEKHVLVGYDKQSKGYKLYNPVIRKVVVSRDVEFDKERSWDWSIQESERYDFLPMTDEEETDESISENAMKRKKCRQAIDGEIRPIERKDTWKLKTILKGQKAIGIKSLYNAKTKRQRRSEKVKGKNCDKSVIQCFHKPGLRQDGLSNIILGFDVVPLLLEYVSWISHIPLEVLVDLRNHGRSTDIEGLSPPHDIINAARDISNLIKSHDWVWPDVVIGHSLGGKVALQYALSCAQGEYGKSAQPRKQVM